jgi:hypothetical protein
MSVVSVVCSPSFVRAAEPTLADQEASRAVPYRLGLGYKIGNGLGFVGLDFVAGISPRISVGLQGNYLSFTNSFDERATGYGVVPFAQFRLWPAGSTPYLVAGPLYATLSSDDVTASGFGGIANLGWEWMWRSGLSLNIGAGVGYLGSIEATNGFSSIERSGGAHFNLESALRYYFR